MSDAVIDHPTEAPAAQNVVRGPGWLRRAFDSDLFYSFRRSKLTMVATAIAILFFLLAISAPWLAVQNPFDPAQLQLMNSRIAPLWTADGQSPFLLGTDAQGRDVLSAILYGVAYSVFGIYLDSTCLLAVLVFAIDLSFWVQYARTVRGAVLVEKN